MRMLSKFLKNYSNTMRKINSNILPFGSKINNDTSRFKVKVNHPPVSKSKSPISPKSNQTARITFALNANLCQQAENWLNSRWVQQDFTYPSLSELIRKSLTAYQEGKIKVNETRQDMFLFIYFSGVSTQNFNSLLLYWKYCWLFG